MSVIVKGMKMPTSCCQCPVHMDVCKRGYEYRLAHPELYDKRAADCPIVSVPTHGRLIDEQWLKDAMITTLEALKKNPKMDRQEMHLIAAFDTLRAMVEDAPTIIPAEVNE